MKMKKFLTTYLGAFIFTIMAVGHVAADAFISNAEQGNYTSARSSFNGAAIFKINAQNDIHIGLSSGDKIDREFVIGGWNNTKSVIRDGAGALGGKKLVEFPGANISKPGEAAYYWLLADNESKKLAFGEGKVPGLNVTIEWVDPNFVPNLQYVSLSSWDSTIEYLDEQSADVVFDKGMDALEEDKLMKEGVIEEVPASEQAPASQAASVEAAPVGAEAAMAVEKEKKEKKSKKEKKAKKDKKRQKRAQSKERQKR